MQVLAFNLRVEPCSTVRIKKHAWAQGGYQTALRPVVTRGAWVEESRKGPKLVFRA
jgi:hypothetical protein